MPKYFQDQKGVAHILVIVLLLLGLGLGLYLVTQRTNIFSRASTSSPIGTLSVSGKVFIDTNQNRQLDTGEQPFAGNSVKLSQSGNTLQTATSDRNGDYIFSNLSAGRYRVTYTIPTGYNRVSDDSFEFTLDSNKNFNFAIAPKSASTPEGSYKISGQVFVDSNSNGRFDSGESLYPSAQITVYQESTTSNGDYQLVVGPARYRISVRVPDGYERTTDDSFEFELNSDKVFNFGIRSKTAAAPVPVPTPTPTPTATPRPTPTPTPVSRTVTFTPSIGNNAAFKITEYRLSSSNSCLLNDPNCSYRASIVAQNTYGIPLSRPTFYTSSYYYPNALSFIGFNGVSTTSRSTNDSRIVQPNETVSTVVTVKVPSSAAVGTVPIYFYVTGQQCNTNPSDCAWLSASSYTVMVTVR